jgi:hypothetical protein
MSWHFGDGLEPLGWLSDAGTPRPILSPGGQGESALIGDPSVVEWKGKVHLFYEGTDNCNGNDNYIFHAVSDSLFGPFTKTGKVTGIKGHNEPGGPGFSWPKAFIENDQLYITYTDNYLSLLIAKASNDQATEFTMSNNSLRIIPDHSVIGEIKKFDNKYHLVYQGFDGDIKYTSSNNMFSFPNGQVIITKGKHSWDQNAVSLPGWITSSNTHDQSIRVYYGVSPKSENGFTCSSIAVCKLILPTPIASPTTTQPSPTTKIIKGDANGDHQVNLSDFVIWKKEYLGIVDTQLSDFNQDHQVTLADFVVWKRSYLGL